MIYDIKIVNGTIVDGTGKAGYAGDVGIKDGRVVALGAAPLDASRTIDAAGHVVAPGFVDIHTHYDAQILWDPDLSVSSWHGVTTVVIGNCGFGIAPTRPTHRDLILRTLEKVEGMSLEALRAGLGDTWPFETFSDYLDVLDRRSVAINVGVLFGHTPLRLYAMGEDAVRRPASGAEIATMSGLVGDAMAAGALGFATSHSVTHNGFDGYPVPSRLASLEEIDALVGAMTAAGGGIMQATIGKTLFFDEFAALARAHGVTITWTALLAGLAGPGSHRRMLERTHELIEHQGLDIVPQVSCRPLNFDFEFNEPFPFESRPMFGETMKTDRAGRRAIYDDPAFRAAFKEDTAAGAKNPLAQWWTRTVISRAPQDPTLEERPLLEVAEERGVHPIDLALDLSVESDFQARFRLAVLNYDEAEVAELLTDPLGVVALSDAGAHASQLCDACYATYLLGHWVRERGVLALEEAVRMLTSRPAALFGIADRGRLEPGRPADIVVFDPETIGAGPLRRVRDLPGGADRLVVDAYGISTMLVNGVPTREGNRPTGALPGRVLRRGRSG